MSIAVWPVISTSPAVCSSRPPARARRLWTRSSVFLSAGPVVGTTLRMAVSPASLATAGETEATPSTLARALPTVSPAALASLALTVTISGPLKPAPKDSDSMSYALRWVVSVDMVPSPGRPSSRLAAGTASAPRLTTPTSRTATGLRST